MPNCQSANLRWLLDPSRLSPGSQHELPIAIFPSQPRWRAACFVGWSGGPAHVGLEKNRCLWAVERSGNGRHLFEIMSATRRGRPAPAGAPSSIGCGKRTTRRKSAHDAPRPSNRRVGDAVRATKTIVGRGRAEVVCWLQKRQRAVRQRTPMAPNPQHARWQRHFQHPGSLSQKCLL